MPCTSYIAPAWSDNRFAAAQWGSGAELKASAFEQLLAMS